MGGNGENTSSELERLKYDFQDTRWINWAKNIMRHRSGDTGWGTQRSGSEIHVRGPAASPLKSTRSLQRAIPLPDMDRYKPSK